jgi:hypothetical protein
MIPLSNARPGSELVGRAVAPLIPPQMQVVLHWFEELKARVPAR